MGTESLGVIGCIFAENGPLEGGIESSFWGTGWGAKGDFMRYSYLYPYIFESRTHTFFESTCPELYEQQSWEWSDAYSWRNDLWKVNFKRVCEKPAGVLMVIWSGFLAPIRSFSKGAPHHFPKAHALRYGHRKFGNDRMHIRGEWALRRWWVSGVPAGVLRVISDFWPRSVHFRRGPPTIFRKHMPSGMGTESLGVIGCIFAENGPLEGGIESSFWGTGWGAKGDFMRYSYLYPYIFESRTHTFFESTCPELYEQQSWEWSDAYSWRNDLWKVNFKRVCEKPAGVLMVIWSRFLAPIRSFSKGAPHHFPKAHALRYGHRKFGMIGCIFAENGPLEGGMNLVSGVPAGVLRVISDGFLAPILHFRRGPPTIFRKHMPSGMGTESLGVIGCIFAENGPLEGGIESSFWGTGWGAKGDFMRYSYLYPYIFESRTHTFFESTCPELYEQQSWEWSDAYSWRNDLWKVNFKRVCEKPAGVLMVIWSRFLAPIRSFSKGALRRWHWI